MAPQLKAACKYGHPFTAENIVLSKLATGYTVRKCRECRKISDRERYQDKPEHRESKKERAREAYRSTVR